MVGAGFQSSNLFIFKKYEHMSYTLTQTLRWLFQNFCLRLVARMFKLVTMFALRVVMDDREPLGVLGPLLDQHPEIVWSHRRLPVGDFRIGSQAVVERKTMRDFALSLTDGRLFRQVARLCASTAPYPLPKGAEVDGPIAGDQGDPAGYVYRCLILEQECGDVAEATGSSCPVDGSHGVDPRAIRGALIALTLKFGLPVFQVSGPWETVQTLAYLGRQLQQGPRPSPVRLVCRGHSLKHRKLQLLQSIKGVGPQRASELLAHYGSVENIASAPASEIASLPHLGDVTAQEIFDTLHEPTSVYRSGINYLPNPPFCPI